MNDINLLRYHNRSASEINMLLTGDKADEFFSRVVLGETKEGAGLSKLALLLTLTASFACAVFASYVIYHVVIIKDMVIPLLDKSAITKKVEEYKLELRTGGDPYLKDGYTRIALVERTDQEQAPPVVVSSEYQPPIDMEAQPELFTKPVELEGEPKKRKRDKRVLITPMFTGNYTIQFLDINEDDAAKVRTLAKNNDFQLNLIGSTKKSRVKYNVYKEVDSSKTVIAGKKVQFLKSFTKRKDALNYLQNKRFAGIISSDTTYYDHYDMEVCCLGDEAAEKLARGSGIDMKKVKIIKK